MQESLSQIGDPRLVRAPGEFYHLRSEAGLKLQVKFPSGRLSHDPAQASSLMSGAACFYKPAGVDDLVFLLGSQINCGVPNHAWQGFITPFRISSGRGSLLTFSDPLSGRRLRISPEGEDVCELADSEEGASNFSLEPISDVPRNVASKAAELEALPLRRLDKSSSVWKRPFKAPWGKRRVDYEPIHRVPLCRYALTAENFVESLLTGALNKDVAQALGRILPVSEYEKIALRVIGGEDELDALSQVYKPDLWTGRAFPDLRRWIASDRPLRPNITYTGPEEDGLEVFGREGRFTTFPMTLNSVCRELVRPRRRACVVATARNEGLYIIDWLAHHRAMGFEEFFLYTNDNDDGSDAILDILADNGCIRLIRNSVGPRVLPQYKAYGHVFQCVPEILDFKWAAVVDLDEYVSLAPGRFGGILEFLDYHESAAGAPTDSIGLNWVMHPPNKQIRWADHPVWQRFANPMSGPDRHIKSVIRPHRFAHSHCHFPYEPEFGSRTYRNAAGADIGAGSFNDKERGEVAWIDHYYYKSAEEYLFRRTRNGGDNPVVLSANETRVTTGFVLGFLDAFDGEPVQGGQPLGCERSEALNEAAMLRRLPGMEGALSACKETFQRHMKRLVGQMAGDPRFSLEGSPESRLLRMLCEGPSPA